MLPIESARITYPDGSEYRIPDDGTWAKAPPFGVQVVVYYHVDEPGKLRVTKDGGRGDGNLYEWLGEETGPEYAGLKLGLWMDSEGFYRIMDRAGNVRP